MRWPRSSAWSRCRSCAVTGLVLADRLPDEAAAALCAIRDVNENDGRLAPMRDRLVRCRAQLAARPQPPGRADSGDDTATLVGEAVVRALTALEAG